MEHEIIGEVAKAALETTVIYGSGSVDKKGPGPRAKVAHKALERGMNLLFFTCGMIAVAFVLIISIYLVISGMPAILEIGPINFLFGTRWYASTNDFGIFAIILTSFAGTAGAILVGVPVGLMTAIFLSKVAPPKVAAVIHMAVELLAGIPSVIFGLVGMLFFIQMLGLKTGVLAGGLTLVVMILPTIVRTTQESLKTVPNSYREGALAMGAGKWHMVRTVVLPNSVDGIITGCILAVGRIVGESAALLYTAGFGLVLNGFITSLESSSASLTVALYVYASERGETAVAFAIATILMLLTLVINLSANLVGRKLKK